MLRDITLGQYLPRESPIHRLDPRTKILLTLLYIVALFMADNGYPYVLLGFFTLLCYPLARLPLRIIGRSLRPLLFILALTVGLNMIMTSGEVLYRLGPLSLTREGLRLGVLMGVRLGLLIVTTSLLTLTTSPISLTDGMERLLRPFRRLGLPAHELAMMMTIALRFIPTLLEEAEKIMKAQTARGARFTSGNFLVRARNLVPLLVPLFVGAFRRADELALAMEARCYRGGEGRTRMRELHAAARDYLAALVMVAVMAAVLWLRRF